jgi:hypothetical protein
VTARSQPLVAFVCRAPVLCEAVAEALADVAEVQAFPAGRPDPEGLIAALRPDALIVDEDGEAERLTRYARAAQTPLVLIAAETNEVRVLGPDGWALADHGDGIEGIRNLLVAQLFGRSTTRDAYAVAGDRAPDLA